MFDLRTETEIRATSSRIWSVLIDFPAYPAWNPFVRSIEGTPEVGSTLKVSVQPEGGKGMTFQPTVLAAIPNQELRWRGRVLVPGIFDGEHYFQIQPLQSGSSLFIHGERFSGVLIPFFKSALNAGTRAGFVAMNRALKERAEGLPS